MWPQRSYVRRGKAEVTVWIVIDLLLLYSWCIADIYCSQAPIDYLRRRFGFWSHTSKVELNWSIFSGVKWGERSENCVGPSGGFTLTLTNRTALVTLRTHVTRHVTWHVTRCFEAVLFAAIIKINHLCNLGLSLSCLMQWFRWLTNIN